MTSGFFDHLRHEWRAGLADIDGAILKRAFVASLVMLVFFIVKWDTIGAFALTHGNAPQQDYWAFHVAAEAGREDAAALYDAASFRAQFAEPAGFLWFYPPTMLLALFPFGLLSYGAAKAVWMVAGFSLLCLTAWRVSKGNAVLTIAAALSPAMFAVFFTGQLSIFFACLAAVGFYHARTRPILAGICFGLLTMKPQLGLIAPVFLLLTGSWRAIGWACVTAVMLGLGAVAAFGLAPWMAFIESLSTTHSGYAGSSGHIGRITLADSLRILGWLSAPVFGVAIASFAAACVALMLAVRTQASRTQLASIAMMLSAATAPYFWVYDWLFVSLAMLIFLSGRPKLNIATQLAIAAAWFAPLAPYLSGAVSLVPVIWLVLSCAAFAMLSAVIRPAKFKLAFQRI